MKKFVSAFSVLTLALGAAALPAFADSLYATYGKKSPLKVFVATIGDKTGKNKVKTGELKVAIEEALKARKSIRFEIVPTRDLADIEVDTDVTEIYWTNHDPIDMIMGVGATAMDAAVIEDYARMSADFKVTDVKTGRLAWSDRLKATLTKKDMPEDKSLELIGPDMAKVFVTTAFGKKQASRR